MSKVRVTFTEKFALENYGVVTYHGVMIPLYGLIDKFIEIFYIEVVAEDVKMFYELKFKNKLTIDQKLRLIAETYRGRLLIRDFSSFGTNISFAEKQLRFVPDWYIFANGPITKYVLGNNTYSEFYYDPLTEDDKWVRYFGIIPKTVPLITSLFNRTSKVMGQLITGIPAAPVTEPNVRGSGRNLPPPRPPRRGPPGPPSAVPPPPPVHTVDAGEIFSPLNISPETLNEGRKSLRSIIPDTVEPVDVAEIVAAAGLDLSHIAPSAGDKISTTEDITLESYSLPYSLPYSLSVSKGEEDVGSDEEVKPKPMIEEDEGEMDSEHGGLSFTQPEIDALKKRQAKEQEALLAHSGEREDLTAAQQRLIDEKSEEANRATEPADAASTELAPTYEEIVYPGSNELYLLEYAPDFSEKVTLDSPPAYDTLEQTVIELLPTPKTIQTFMSNIFQIQYQSTLDQLKTMAKDPTLMKYIPKGSLKTSMNKSTHVKVILKAYTDFISNQGYDYDEVKEEKVLYNSVAYMLENFGSLKGAKKSELEKFKTDYVNSLKFDPEDLKKLSVSERKLIAAKEERTLAAIQASLDTEETMKKTGAIDGPKLASAFIANETINFPPLDSSGNIAAVLSVLGHASKDQIKKIMAKYKQTVAVSKDKATIVSIVKEYFTSLNVPGTKQFITSFAFKDTGGLIGYAKQAK